MAASGLWKCPCTTTTARFGKSQFFNYRRLFRTGKDMLRLWYELVIRREHRSARRHAPHGSSGSGRPRVLAFTAAVNPRLSRVLSRP